MPAVMRQGGARAATILVAAILAAGGCTTPGADVPSDALSSVAPGPPSVVPSVVPSQEASASAVPSPNVTPSPTPLVPAAWRDQLLATPFAEWVVDRWLVGYYGGRAVEAQVPATSRIVASGSAAFALTPGAMGTIALVDPLTGRSTQVIDVGPVPPDSSIIVDRAGRLAFVHGNDNGRDVGVRRVDLATGKVDVIIGPSDPPDGYERNRLFVSPSGATVVSTLCDYVTCFIDVIDAIEGTSRRLDKKLGILAITDRYLLGGHPWSIIDLANDTVRPLPEDLLIQVSVGVPNGEERFLVATVQLGLGRYDIVDVDAKGADHKVVLSQTEEPIIWAFGRNLPPGMLLMSTGSQGVAMDEVLSGSGELRVLLGDGQGLLDEVVTTEKPAP